MSPPARTNARPDRGRTALLALCAAWCALALLAGCDRGAGPVAAARPEARVRHAPEARSEQVTDLEPGAVDLLPLLRRGSIDVAGPVVDFGDEQAAPYVLSPAPTASHTINGDSWSSVGPRVRVRVPVSLTSPPSVLRIRVRRPQARRVTAIVDGLLARQANLPTGPLPAVVELPVAPDRFRREQAEVELRFGGMPRVVGAQRSRVVVAAPRAHSRRVVVARRGARRQRPARRMPLPVPVPRPTRAATPSPAPPAAVELDWLHLARDRTPTLSVNDLVAEVRIQGPPRRALTLYAPTALQAVTVIPAEATLRAAFSAEGVRGGTGERPMVRARIRVEADGVAPVEVVREVRPDAPWEEVTLDLAPLGGRPATLSVSAEGDGTLRLAVADPRIVSRTPTLPEAPPQVRHVVMVVVRGARLDRFQPQLSSRLSHGGFSRLLREGQFARAIAPSSHDIPALASTATGLPADAHRMTLLTDTLDDNAPTLASYLASSGVSTAGFADDQWFAGSGLARGLNTLGGCPREQGFCRAELVFSQAAEWLTRQREARTFALIVTRAGVPPFDTPPDILATLDPNPYEGTITPEQSGLLAARSRHAALSLESREMDRLATLYDASLAGVDRGIATLMDRLRDAGMTNDTAVIVVGDHGCALGESGLLGEGPMSLGVVSQTVLIVRSPGVPARTLNEPAAVIDAAATALERLGVQPAGQDPGARAGAASLLAPRGPVLHTRGVVIAGNARFDLGLSFGSLLALPRSTGTLALIAPADDALGATDVAVVRPISRAFAEAVLTAYRTPGADDPFVRTYAPSTRPLPAPVETAYRNAAWLRR